MQRDQNSKKSQVMHVFAIVCKEREPINSDIGIWKQKKVLPNVEDRTLTDHHVAQVTAL